MYVFGYLVYVNSYVLLLYKNGFILYTHVSAIGFFLLDKREDIFHKST